MKKTELENQKQVWKGCKNNRSDSKHGTFRKDGQPPIDTPEETSAIPFKKMKPKSEAYNILYIRKKRLCNKIGYTEKIGKRILREEQNHTNTATTPFLEKEDYTTGKTTRIHSEKSKQTIEADCRFGSEISNYLSTVLKGWGIWVSNRLPGK